MRERKNDDDVSFPLKIKSHETAHTILTVFNEETDRSIMSSDGRTTLRRAVENAFAIRPAIWDNTYSAQSFQEYWAVGAQIW